MRLLVVSPRQILIDQQGHPVTCVEHDDVIYFADWYSCGWLEKAIIKFGRPQLVISDVEGSLAPHPVPRVFIPDLPAGIRYKHRIHRQAAWCPEQNTIVNIEELITNTTDCFNFSVNKKRHDRFLLLKLIQWFGLTSYQYTWSGDGHVMDMSPVLAEIQSLPTQHNWLSSDFLTHILSPITGLATRWHDLVDTMGIQNHQQEYFTGLPQDQWTTFKRQLTEQTVVSLVCDSTSNLEPNFTITERTLYYIGGLNFAIFAGHYGQAEQMQRMGIDTFADIIDHSYQWHNTMVERMYYAIHDNLRILSDFDYARELRYKLAHRLQQNKNYVFGSEFDQWIKQQYQLLPPGLTESLQQLAQNPPAVNR